MKKLTKKERKLILKAAEMIANRERYVRKSGIPVIAKWGCNVLKDLGSDDLSQKYRDFYYQTKAVFRDGDTVMGGHDIDWRMTALCLFAEVG